MYKFGDIVSYNTTDGKVTARVIEQNKNNLIVAPIYNQGEQRTEISIISIKANLCKRVSSDSAIDKIEYRSNQ